MTNVKCTQVGSVSLSSSYWSCKAFEGLNAMIYWGPQVKKWMWCASNIYLEALIYDSRCEYYGGTWGGKSVFSANTLQNNNRNNILQHKHNIKMSERLIREAPIDTRRRLQKNPNYVHHSSAARSSTARVIKTSSATYQFLWRTLQRPYTVSTFSIYVCVSSSSRRKNSLSFGKLKN